MIGGNWQVKLEIRNQRYENGGLKPPNEIQMVRPFSRRQCQAPVIGTFGSSREDGSFTMAAEPISHEFIHMRARENTPWSTQATKAGGHGARPTLGNVPFAHSAPHTSTQSTLRSSFALATHHMAVNSPT